jgi:hypothetical protein
MSATPHLDRLCEMANKALQANGIVRFDDAAWLVEHLYDLSIETGTLKNMELPIEHLERVTAVLVGQMDVILEKCRAVAAMKARIIDLENQLAGVA